MKHLPKDDGRLVDFLRQNFPSPPAASPDLEAQILEAIASLPDREKHQELATQPDRRNGRVLPLWEWRGAIVAASLLAAWTGYRLFTPQRLTPIDLVSLEAFVETNWNGVVSDAPTVEPVFEWFFSAQPSSESEDVGKVTSRK